MAALVERDGGGATKRAAQTSEAPTDAAAAVMVADPSALAPPSPETHQLENWEFLFDFQGTAWQSLHRRTCGAVFPNRNFPEKILRGVPFGPAQRSPVGRVGTYVEENFRSPNEN